MIARALMLVNRGSRTGSWLTAHENITHIVHGIKWVIFFDGNRHGVIAGATCTGKTVSLIVLVEGFPRMGMPVSVADVKGDISGLATERSSYPSGFRPA